MKLEKVLTYQKGKSPQKDLVSNNLILYLTPEYLRGVGSPNFISDFPSKVEVEDGDLLLLWDGSNAGEFFKGKKGFLASTMVKFKFNEEEFQREFLFYQLKAFEGYLKAQTNGSGIPHVDRELLLEIEVAKFEKFEQIRIAEILSKADAAIVQTEGLISKYQRIKTGLMQDLLTRGIDEQGKIRSRKTHRFEVKNGIEVPEEWEVDCLEKYSLIHNNLRKPISSLVRFENKGIYPYYGATGIIDYINEYRVDGKYVLIGEDGDHFLKFEKQNMTHLVDGKFNVSNHAHILSGKENCLTEWVHYFFCNRDITYFLTRQGAGRFKLNKATLLNLPICVPKSKEEQKKIIEKIISFEKQFQNIQIYREKLQSLKFGLMQDLLSGKVRVKVEEQDQKTTYACL